LSRRVLPHVSRQPNPLLIVSVRRTHRADPSRLAVFGIVQRDVVRIHFNRADRAVAHPGRAESAYDIYFHVSGVDDLATELRKRGAAVLDGPKTACRGGVNSSSATATG